MLFDFNCMRQRRGGLPDNIYRPTPEGSLEQVENDTHEPDFTQLERLHC